MRTVAETANTKQAEVDPTWAYHPFRYPLSPQWIETSGSTPAWALQRQIEIGSADLKVMAPSEHLDAA